MAYLTTFPALYSGLDTPVSGAAQTEPQTIPLTAPYTLLLSRIPRCAATAASVVNNPFTTIAALRTECAVTINGVPATIIEGQTPTASGQVAMQITQGGQYEFSPLVTFHSSDAGKTAVFTYFGFMSNADSRYIVALQQAVNRLEDLPPCAILAASTYDGGAFGRGTADSASVYVAGLRGALSTASGYLSFSGGTLTLASGVTQVSAFSDVDGYKTISVYLRLVSTALALRIAESAESAEKPTTPTITAADGWLCGAIIVQGDGTGAAGGILPIAQAECFSLWNMAGGGTAASSSATAFTFALWGALPATEAIDVAHVAPTAATISRVTVFLSESGTAGSTIFDVQTKASGGAWTSRYASTSVMPTIAYNAGNEATLDSPSTAMLDNAIPAGSLLRVVCPSVATGAATARVTVWCV